MRLSNITLFVACGCLLSFGQGVKPNTLAEQPQTQTAGEEARSPAETNSAYVPVHKFDAKRDAAADIQAAIAEAQRTGKRIILDIGGDWCQYCHQMDDLFRDHPDLIELRNKKFVTVAIYYGSDNKNQAALSHYSKVLGIPHFFVLEEDGSLLHSQRAFDLSTRGKYDPEKMKSFLMMWSPPAKETAQKSNN